MITPVHYDETITLLLIMSNELFFQFKIKYEKLSFINEIKLDNIESTRHSALRAELGVRHKADIDNPENPT